MRMTVDQSLAGLYEASWAQMIDVRAPDVLAHLAGERELAAQLASAGGYRSLAEIGCADGSLLLPVAARLGLDYLGIDVAAGAVAAARVALADLAMTGQALPGQALAGQALAGQALAGQALAGQALAGQATTGQALPGRRASGTVVRADATDLPELARELPRPLLAAFPFNVIGILPDPCGALARCGDADVLVLTYDTGPAAAELRMQYYRGAGFSGSMHRDADGVHFSAGDFESSVFEPPVITGWLRDLGLEVTVHRYGTAGLGYLGSRP